MIDRRKFILSGAVFFAATSVAPCSFANSLIQFGKPIKDKSMIGHYEERLNHNFVASNDKHSFNIKLDEVRPYAHSNTIGLEQFELIFKANSKEDLSGLYRVSRADTLETHLLRLEQRGRKNNYSAVYALFI